MLKNSLARKKELKAHLSPFRRRALRPFFVQRVRVVQPGLQTRLAMGLHRVLAFAHCAALGKEMRELCTAVRRVPLCHVYQSPSPPCKYRTAKLRERAYNLFDGDGMYLFVKPNGVKTWRLKYTYTMPSGKEGTLIIGNESMPSSQYF
jgi:hypothetical protein